MHALLIFFIIFAAFGTCWALTVTSLEKYLEHEAWRAREEARFSSI